VAETKVHRAASQSDKWDQEPQSRHGHRLSAPHQSKDVDALGDSQRASEVPISGGIRYVRFRPGSVGMRWLFIGVLSDPGGAQWQT